VFKAETPFSLDGGTTIQFSGFKHWAVRVGDFIHEAYSEGEKGIFTYNCCEVSSSTDEQYPSEIEIGFTDLTNAELKDVGESHPSEIRFLFSTAD
jgi:hypothetical protein